VVSAQQPLSHHLILHLSTLFHPVGPSALLEPIIRDLPSLNYSKRLRKAFLENLRQSLLLIIRQKMSPAELLRDLPQNNVFGWLAGRCSSLVTQRAAI